MNFNNTIPAEEVKALLESALDKKRNISKGDSTMRMNEFSHQQPFSQEDEEEEHVINHNFQTPNVQNPAARSVFSNNKTLPTNTTFLGSTVPEQWGDAQLTKAQVDTYLKRFAVNFSEEASKSIEKTLKAKIDGTDIGDLSRAEDGGGNTSKFPNTEEIGRSVYGKVIQLIRDCGGPLYVVVVTNYSVNNCVMEMSAELSVQNVRCAEIDAIISSLSTSHYSDQYLKAKNKVESKDKKRLLLNLHLCYWACSGITSVEEEGIIKEGIDPPKKVIEQYTGQKWQKRPTVQDVVELAANQLYGHPQLKLPERIMSSYDLYFQDSTHYQTYVLSDVVTLNEEMEAKYYRRFLIECDEQIDKNEKIRLLKEEQMTLRKAAQSLTVITHVNIAYSTAITLITAKIKRAFQLYEDIKAKLRSTVQLNNHGAEPGEVIVNPLDNSNLAGILENLRLAYADANLVAFKHKLMEVLNYKVPKEKMDDPMFAIQAITQKMQLWQSMKLFQYLTEDIFWTVVYLRAHDISSTFYNEALQVSMEYIYKIETQKEAIPQDQALLHPNMPIFSHLKTWVTKVKVPAIEFTNGKKRGVYLSNAAQNTTPRGRYSDGKNRTNNTENGYIATDTMAEATIITTESFDKEVTRKDNFCILLETNGTRVPYTATLKRCMLCDRTTKKTNKTHQPLCYAGQCQICRYFGHKAPNCHQKNQAQQTQQQGSHKKET